MLERTVPIAFCFIFLLTHTNSMIMRNNALMTKLVSQFQVKDRTSENINNSNELAPGKPNVVSLMQNVLCRNFPSIPCDLITKDLTLQKLIEKSIQQIEYKKESMDKTTLSPSPGRSLYPEIINSEDLSNFLQVHSNTGYNKQKKKQKTKNKPNKPVNAKNFWSHEAQTKKRTHKMAVFNGRKIRKFYPHKIKYKDKNVKPDFVNYSEEKLSMSVEVPESQTGVKRRNFSYRNQPDDPPVWRIDYMKHGEPSLNLFEYEAEGLKGKIMKTSPNVVVDGNVPQSAVRRDVLHSDVYIKNNYVRKSSDDLNSNAMD
ncbi:Uncharacterized protein OBRU01_14471 [Operophtera brumata]|uniref:Uncharacterized protein n=1 Tax=Operophtera brumata TaxID=104452 RepID=A0A0L7L6S1_OPEBR|nr:Uncharacterized protein OBRU01_14471 [Operophtera brumata]